jgi:hypothetical protein
VAKKKQPPWLQKISEDPSAEVMAPAVRGTKNARPGGDPDAAREMAEQTVGRKKKKK